MSEPIEIDTHRGTVHALWDAPATSSELAVALVGGADGGFEGPAEGLYPTLVEDFTAGGIGVLRVDFRVKKFPNDVEEGAHDLRAGLDWLRGQGVLRAAVVGHSFGGAVVIEAGVLSRLAVAVVTLATQTAGAEHVARLAPKPLLLIHGSDDIRLSPRCSEVLYQMAGEPKGLVIVEGATHSLRQAREEVRRMVRTFVERSLRDEELPPSED